jgi:hypothetical protein
VPSAVQLLPSLASKALEACVVLVARLTFIPGAAFVQQFVSSNGLQSSCIASILGSVSHGSAALQAAGQPGDAVIVEALHLLSNVARASAAHYPALQVRWDDHGLQLLIMLMMMMLLLVVILVLHNVALSSAGMQLAAAAVLLAAAQERRRARARLLTRRQFVSVGGLAAVTWQQR